MSVPKLPWDFGMIPFGEPKEDFCPAPGDESKSEIFLHNLDIPAIDHIVVNRATFYFFLPYAHFHR